jgi:hypothetical protein
MHVDFTGGLGSIAEQEIIGSSLVGDTTTPRLVLDQRPERQHCY